MTAASISTGGSLFARIDNSNGGTINNAAALSMSFGGNVTSGPFTADMLNNFGHIATSATVDFHAAGDVTVTGSAFSSIYSPNGSIGSDATASVSANNFSASGDLVFGITNDGGSIGGNAAAALNVTDNIASSFGNFFLNISSNGGSIGKDATVNLSTAGLSAGLLETVISNNGGIINGMAAVNDQISGNVVSTGDTFFQILNNDAGSGPGTIGGDATVNVTAGNISVNSLAAQINNSNGGSVNGNANVNINVSGAINSQGNIDFSIYSGSGNITGNAAVSVNLSGGVTTPATLGSTIFGVASGNIGGNAAIAVSTSGDITAGFGVFHIYNNDAGSGAGIIGLNALVDVSANNISAGSLETAISNEGGSIGGKASIGFSAAGDITTTSGGALFAISNALGAGDIAGMISSDATINLGASTVSIGGDLSIFISNHGGGTISGDATINVNATNTAKADSLETEIDNTGGTIGGNAAINMNVSGTATVTNDATVAIYGSDGAASSAINFTGGSYDVGGTFSAFTDGNGTITFNNASVLHADVLKVGALGTNGVLNIGGGTLSADTTLKLYAGGSNGTINFKADVTLGGSSAKILAANSVTIFNNVTVTIGGTTAADVYTNNANYSTTYGGNGSTTGTFAGAGANTQSLSGAPTFDDPPPPSTVTTTSSTTSTTVKSPTLATTSGTTSTKISSTTLSGSKTTSTKATSATIDVSSTAELLSLLDGVSVGPDGKATISGSKSTSNLKNLSGTNINGLSRAEHRMLIQQMHDRDTPRLGGKRIL
jgi:hypothetical protein